MAPSIDIFTVTIAEPITTLTDYALAVIGGWFGWKLVFAETHRKIQARQLWGGAMLCTGLAALLGATSHGFSHYLGNVAALLLWKGTVYAIGVSMLCAVAGTIAGTASATGIVERRVLHAINIAAFAVYALWMLHHDDFIYVIYHYVPASIFIAVLQLLALWRTRASNARWHARLPSAPWLIGGVLVTLAGAAVQQSGLALHVHFNQNDLFHVIQMGGLYLLYRGAALLDDSAH